MTTPKHSEPQGERNRVASKASFTGVRLRKHADYQAAYARARKHQSTSMSWFLAPRPVSSPVSLISPTGADAETCAEIPAEALGPRVGLTAGKVLGKAHDRNRIKRRMREVLRRHLDLLPQISGQAANSMTADLILHPRRTVLTMDFAKLEAEIVRILNQARAELVRFANQAHTEMQATLKQPNGRRNP